MVSGFFIGHKAMIRLALLTSFTHGHIIRGQAPTANSITWAPCDVSVDPLIPADAALGLQCANFPVPIVHDQPTGEQVQLGLMKLPANGSRIGNLFINPGGPGAPASTQLVSFAEGSLPMSATIFNTFDFIAMDPRGVGRSTPSMCNITLANIPVTDVTTAVGLQQTTQLNQELGASCRAEMGLLFDNMDTIALAKDMELVRVALGDEDMNYFGQSYGTQLGAQYAALFPARIRTMMLDGILQHTGDYTSNVLTQTKALDAAIQNYFDRCAANTTINCGPEGLNMRQLWATVVSQAAAGTLQAPGCDNTPATGCFKDVSVSDLLGRARGLTESPGGQRRLANILTLSGTGNASFADLFARSLVGGSVFDQSSSFSITNVQCQDEWFVDATRAPDPLANVTALAAMVRGVTVTPGMGEFFRRTLDCTGWPVKITNPRAALDVKGLKNPVLLVHTTNDPATSPDYAQGMLKEIQGSVLLKRDMLGHTSYYSQGATTAAMDAYLVNLTVPMTGTVLST